MIYLRSNSGGFLTNSLKRGLTSPSIEYPVSELLLDLFTDSNGTALDAHTMNIGSGWTEHVGTWEISGNALVQTTASGRNVATADAGDANIRARIRVKTNAASGSQSAGLVFRYSDTSNYWILEVDWDGQRVIITKIASGVVTSEAQVSWDRKYQSYVDVEVICDGDIITAYFDGGYELSVTDSFNNTATRFGIGEFRDFGFGAVTFDEFQAVDLQIYELSRMGTVLQASVASEENAVYEPTVIYDSNAQILSGNVFKMWYTGGVVNPAIFYAESLDGSTWTKYASNPVLDSYWRGIVLKYSGTYYMYVVNEAATQVDLYTSTDGITWGLDTSAVLALGGGGSWDDNEFGNIFVWLDGDWKMLYEARQSAVTWKIGYATSSDGVTWAKSGSNPVISLDGSVGGPWVKKVGTYYYLWFHRAPRSTLPTYVHRYRSTNLTSWTPYPYMGEIPRIGTDEGENTEVGQTADVDLVEFSGSVYIYYSACPDGSDPDGDGSTPTTGLHIKLATAPLNAIYEY